ncbi:FtsX-like permease family protein [Dactylosporangium sp. AC04546]|uniref:ABC transporter permease n=1 Tax=Dactylosporangium sp. AC04546 TaxID=2862460 RepID=UPI001EDD940A|nr:FtsX-like permease family protein [Dactylosporangium sp. AC04546]WVK88566.1 FtsX-like permease family protein [Dactylosporangium sp. AC04546]
MRAVVRAATAAVRRRRLQSVVIGLVVLLASATGVLAAGLIATSTGPFDRAFARQQGAHAAVAYDPAKVTADALRGTATASGVTAAAGPYDTVKASVLIDGGRGPKVDIAGRSEATPAVDKLEIVDGGWLTGPGQIVLSAQIRSPRLKVGDEVGIGVLPNGASQPKLRLVGFAASVTGTAQAWVWPSQTDVLQAAGAETGRQMLYRFASAGTDDAVRDALATATASLPADAVTGSARYHAVRLEVNGNIATMVPFVVAFAVLGLIMSVLIVANVVGGAVVSGYRTIGVLKSLGYTPRQVVAVYAGQAMLVGLPAAALGVLLGNLLALPLLSQTEEAYGIPGARIVPLWLSLAALVAVPLLVGLAAVVPATRAGRLSATQAVAVGRAPRSGRGYRIRRLLAATTLPRPVSFGLGTPFARPGRSAMTVVAVLLGAMTVVLAIGLSTSFGVVKEHFARTGSVQVVVDVLSAAPEGEGRVMMPAGGPKPGETLDPVDPAAVRRTIEAQPGTARVVGLTRTEVTMAGLAEPVEVEAYDGDATWTGYPLISGRWYAGAGEAVAGSRMLSLTGTRVGDTITVSTDQGQLRVKIVGEAFSRAGDPTLIMDRASLGTLIKASGPNRFEVALTSGTDPYAYAKTLDEAVGSNAVIPVAAAEGSGSETLTLMIGLVVTLATLLSAVAALGVFNTVVLNTRDRVHEIGVLKSIGMTPGQVRLMVIASMTVVGLVGGLLAVPLGLLLHHRLLPVIAGAAGTGIPADVIDVYSWPVLAVCALLGVALAVLGALVPATWAGRTRASTALRAE